MRDDEQRLLNDPEYAEAWVEQEIERSRDYFLREVLGEEEKINDDAHWKEMWAEYYNSQGFGGFW